MKLNIILGIVSIGLMFYFLEKFSHTRKESNLKKSENDLKNKISMLIEKVSDLEKNLLSYQKHCNCEELASKYDQILLQLSEIAKTINKTNKVDSVLQQILKNIHQLKQEILDLNNYSKKNIEKIELINIDDKPENTNSDNEKYKHKHPDLNTNRSHIIDKFNVKRNNNMLYLFDNNFNTVSTNLKKLKNISKITNVLQSFDNEDSVILQKNLQSYLDRIEKTEKLIKLGKIEESELSEKLTDQFINIVERSFVYKIIDSIYRAMAVNKLPDMYTALLKAINEYLEQLSIYTFDSNDIQLGKKLSDSYLDYYNIETFNVSTESEHGNVREIQLLAYYVPFLNENNEADQYWIRGRVIINKFKEA